MVNMKIFNIEKISVAIFFLFLFIIYGIVSGQEKITKEEWQKQMDDFTLKKKKITGMINELKKSIDVLQSNLNAKMQESHKAEDEYWSIIGGKEKYQIYSNKLNYLEMKCKNKEVSLKDAEDMFQELDTKLKCHPDFEQRYLILKKYINSIIRDNDRDQ
jgi:hypothetical protein